MAGAPEFESGLAVLETARLASYLMPLNKNPALGGVLEVTNDEAFRPYA